MAKRLAKKHSEAVRLRLLGWSYSQIKNKLKVSKGSLSLWLNDYPLPEARLRELRDFNPKRIERFRNTMRLKRETKLLKIYGEVGKFWGDPKKRDMLIAGLFLYWGEGSKSGRTTSGLTNTDPSALVFFLKWLRILGVSRNKVKVRLHLYRDMSQEKELKFWSKKLKIPPNQFQRPYIKKSALTDITYKNGYGHGTCMIRFESVSFHDWVLMSLKYIKDNWAK